MHSLVERSLLIGLTHYDHQGSLLHQEEFFGTIKGFTEQGLIIVENTVGQIKYLPPEIMAIVEAPTGEYRCLSSGESIVNPDMLTRWCVHYPAGSEDYTDWRPNLMPLLADQPDPDNWNFDYQFNMERLEQVIAARKHQYIGKYLIAGLRHYSVQKDGSTEMMRQEQRHGRIVRVSIEEGIVVKEESGREFELPPDLLMLQPAPPGEYRLRDSGEVIIAPDFITTWGVDKPAE